MNSVDRISKEKKKKVTTISQNIDVSIKISIVQCAFLLHFPKIELFITCSSFHFINWCVVLFTCGVSTGAGENRALFMTVRNWLDFYFFPFICGRSLYSRSFCGLSFLFVKFSISFINFPVRAFILCLCIGNHEKRFDFISNARKHVLHSSNAWNNDKVNYGVITWKTELFEDDLP